MIKSRELRVEDFENVNIILDVQSGILNPDLVTDSMENKPDGIH